MATFETLGWNIFANDRGAGATFRRLRNDILSTAKGADRFQVSANALGEIAGRALYNFAARAGRALYDFGKNSISAASAANEAQNKVAVVFGQSARSVLAFSQTTARGLGISRTETLKAAGTFGNLLVSLKLPQAEAAKMSVRMVQLAGDMASFNDVTPDEALTALRAALVGEQEPLRRLGVSFNDAELRAYAFSKGIYSGQGPLNGQQRALAAYDLILQKTKVQQGDFARTSTGFANAARQGRAVYSELSAELGKNLAPVLANVLIRTLDFTRFLQRNASVVGPLVAVLASLATSIWAVNRATAIFTAGKDAIGAVSKTWHTFADAVKRAGAEAGTVRGRLSGLIGLVGGPWLFALTGAVAAIALWAKKQQELKQRVREMTDSLNAQTGAVTENSRAIAFKNLQDSGAIKSARQLGLDLRVVTDAALGNTRAMEVVAQRIDSAGQAAADMATSSGDAAEASREQARAAINLRDAVGTGNKVIKDAQRAYRDARDAGIGMSNATDDAAIAQGNLGTETDNTTQALKDQARVVLGLRRGQNSYEAAIDAATESLKTNGATLNVHTTKGRANREALDSIAQAALDWRDSVKEADGSVKDQNRVLIQARKQLVETAIKFGLGETAARKYADEVLNIPEKYRTNFEANTKKATDAVKNFRNFTNAELKAINDERVNVGLQVNGKSLSVRYSGSKVYLTSGGRTLVARNRGGPIMEGSGHRDDVPALLTRDEHVWTQKEVRAAGGHRAVKRLREMALQGGIGANAYTAFASGGPVVDVNARGPRSVRNITRNYGNAFHRYAQRAQQLATNAIQHATANALVQGLSGVLGGGSASGWRNMWNIVHRAFPGISLISAFRPGARTVSGNLSYHARGRAIDISPSMAVFNWIASHYGRNTKELIYSPAGPRQIWNGRPHFYTGAVRRMHFNHVHWAMANGGMIPEPVFGVGRSGNTYSFGERGPEMVVPQNRGGLGNTYNINVKVGPGSHPGEVGRSIVTYIQEYERRSGSGWRR